MKNEKLIIFDWGGVIESHNEKEYCCSKAALEFLKKLNIDLPNEILLEKYYECCFKCHTINNKQEAFNIFKESFDLECDINEFIKNYQETLSNIYYYQEVVALAHSLKSKYKIGILSNLNVFDKTRIDAQVNLNKFDYVWLSFELGYEKANIKIYDIVEKDINIKPNNIIFIDDIEKNLEIPKAKGWHTCQATGLETEKIKEEIKNFLNN